MSDATISASSLSSKDAGATGTSLPPRATVILARPARRFSVGRPAIYRFLSDGRGWGWVRLADLIAEAEGETTSSPVEFLRAWRGATNMPWRLTVAVAPSSTEPPEYFELTLGDRLEVGEDGWPAEPEERTGYNEPCFTCVLSDPDAGAWANVYVPAGFSDCVLRLVENGVVEIQGGGGSWGSYTVWWHGQDDPSTFDRFPLDEWEEEEREETEWVERKKEHLIQTSGDSWLLNSDDGLDDRGGTCDDRLANSEEALEAINRWKGLAEVPYETMLAVATRLGLAGSSQGVLPACCAEIYEDPEYVASERRHDWASLEEAWAAADNRPTGRDSFSREGDYEAALTRGGEWVDFNGDRGRLEVRRVR